MEAERFFDVVYGGAVDADNLLSIFRLPARATTFHPDAASAAGAASTADAEGHEVYYGVSLRRRGCRGRGAAADVTLVPGVWLDVDTVRGAHKKRAAEDAAALSLIHGLGLPPSLVVDSGGGLHAYWLFGVPCAPEGEVAGLPAAWNRHAAAMARERYGFDVDSTGDLPRVLRVPGTHNRKYGEPRAVRVVEWPATIHRYDPSDVAALADLAPVVQAAPVAQEQAVRVEPSPLVLRPDANPPADKFLMLCRVEPSFGRTFDGVARLKDTTPSGHDFALARTAAAANWTDQEVADLLVAFRRARGWEPGKALRADYIRLTIDKARRSLVTPDAATDVAAIERESREEVAVAVRETIEAAESPEATTEGGRSAVLTGLRKSLGLPLARWRKTGTENATYWAELDDGRVIVIGDAHVVMNPGRFATAVQDALDVAMPLYKAETWRRLRRALGLIVEVEPCPETSWRGVLDGWLASYLHGSIHTGKTWWAGLRENRPFVRGGSLWIHVDDLCRHLRTVVGERATRRQVCSVLKVVGWGRKSWTYRMPDDPCGKGGVVCRSYWGGAPLDDYAELLAERTAVPENGAAETEGDETHNI